MSKITKHIRKWSGGTGLTDIAIRNLMRTEGLQPFAWSGTPGQMDHLHTASYRRVVWVADGSITFNLPHEGQQLTLRKGDRLDLPPGVAHRAVVGPAGLVCLEAHSSLQKNNLLPYPQKYPYGI